jgi:regulator of sigma E protease
MFNLLVFLVVLGVLVVLHEAGHFLVARLLGARAEVFSIGFGKRLWGFERGGTEYRISAVPLGGYVRIPGLGPDESEVVGAEGDSAPILERWKRGLILLAGPLSNVVAAVLFVAVAFMFGIEVPAFENQPSVVGWVEGSSPGAAAGIEPGDRIVAVDGETVDTWRDLNLEMLTAGGREIDIVVLRDGRRLTFRLTPDKVTSYNIGYAGVLPPVPALVGAVQSGSPAASADLQPGDRIVSVNGQPAYYYNLAKLISPHPEEPIDLIVERAGDRFQRSVTPRRNGDRGQIGVQVSFPAKVKHLGPVEAVHEGATECWRITTETFNILGKLVTQRASVRQTMSGPIGIAQLSGDAAREGVRKLIWFMGVISLQLAIFNLLPIPVLDGGHLAVLSVEGIIRRDLSPRLKEGIMWVGFILILMLLAVVSVFDIMRALSEWLPQLGG